MPSDQADCNKKHQTGNSVIPKDLEPYAVIGKCMFIGVVFGDRISTLRRVISAASHWTKSIACPIRVAKLPFGNCAAYSAAACLVASLSISACTAALA